MKRDIILKQISDNLAFSSKGIALENILGLFDSNRIAQVFFMQLFSIVFEEYKDLKDLDVLNDITNYKAVDLGDEKMKIAFQITSEASSKKIKDTIKKFLEENLDIKYKKLVIVIIGIKLKYSTKFDTKNRFELEVWDDEYIIKKINTISDIKKLEKIQNFLKDNLDEFKFPENLFDKDIEKCINILKRDFGSVNSIKNNITKRDENFIENKNIANNISKDFFRKQIRGHLRHNSQIIDFLSRDENFEMKKKYFDITEAMQRFYTINKKDFCSFEDVFYAIYNKVNTYKDNIPGVDIKLKILLHNMYFNCDIGDNP